jgi:hypothetical protein
MSALSATAKATALKSEPPLPKVVISELVLIPWNPATMTILPFSSSFLILSVSIFKIFAFV